MESAVPHMTSRRPRRPHRQLDLLLAETLTPANAAPQWNSLPDQTRQALSGLLTHLLLVHAANVGLLSGGLPEGDADEQ